MKLIVCTFVFLLSLSTFLIAAEISTNSIEGIDQKSVDFQDFVDVEDERTALLFDFNREFTHLVKSILNLKQFLDILCITKCKHLKK